MSLPNLIPVPARSLADEVLLAGPDASVVLSQLGHRTLGMDDLWKVVPGPQESGDKPSRNATVLTAPRVLWWAWEESPSHRRASSPGPLPTRKVWEQLETSPGAASLIVDRDRLLAWAFSDPRAWQPGPFRRYENTTYANAVEWALDTGHVWALSAALRQPNRPPLLLPWVQAAVANAVVNSDVAQLTVLLEQTDVDASALRIEWKKKDYCHQALPVSGPGYPLLHLALTPEMVSALLGAGVDPLAVDAQGKTADQHWKETCARGMKDTRAVITEEKLGLALDVLTEAVAARPSTPEALALVARQNARRFQLLEQTSFETWLATQPRDLVVGPEKKLPSQVLWRLDMEASEMAKRAGALVAHLSPAALQRTAADGVTEQDALWWTLAMGSLKSVFPKLKKACPERVAPGGWVEALEALPALARRPGPHVSEAQNNAAQLRAIFQMLSKAFNDLDLPGHAPLLVDSGLVSLLPVRSPEDWAAASPGQPNLVETLFRLTVDVLEADVKGQVRLPGNVRLPDREAEALAALGAWAKQSPTTPEGEPRHGLLDTALALFGQIARRHLAETKLFSTPEAYLRMAQTGRAVAKPDLQCLPPLLGLIHTLVQSGAVPGPGALEALDKTLPAAFQPIASWARQLHLETRVQASPGPAGRRPRM